LAQSIRENGLLNPVLVYRTPAGRYELIAGQRRFLACQRLGWDSIPAVVRDTPPDATDEGVVLSLIENVQRADMHPVDKARAFQHLLERHGTLPEVSRRTGVSEQTIRRYLDLNQLPETLRNRLSTKEGHVGVEALSQLARQFGQQDEDTILAVYQTIQGFRAGVQTEILKQSHGKPEAVEELAEQAREGLFNTRTCRDGFCFMMDSALRALFADLVAIHETVGVSQIRDALRKRTGTNSQ
jgi:ParB/RepB/Spo0J family partition protein